MVFASAYSFLSRKAWRFFLVEGVEIFKGIFPAYWVGAAQGLIAALRRAKANTITNNIDL